MADTGTLCTSAQTILAMGANATATQILEANTNYWVMMAEADIYAYSGIDFVTNYASVDANLKQFLAAMASHRAAFYGITSNQNAWQLATSQSKLNVIDDIWNKGLKQLLSIQDLSGFA
tara:strand:- start:658 stop:1014 length:357 start_codon:yes stop_codon:yes gene_type:complete